MNNLIELINLEEEKRTLAQREALRLHERLIYDRQMVEIGLASMCRDLKEIRDGKHYITLGFEDFGEYTEKAHGIGSRQAYKYIRIYEKLGADVLNSSAKIGVTKLLEIASLDKDEREELLSEHSADELAEMSTDEVKRLTEKCRRLEEQLSFLEQNPPAPKVVVKQPFDELQSELRAEVEAELRSEYDARISELESKVMTDDELRKYRANAEKEAKAAASEEAKKLKADLKAAKDEAKAKAEAAKAAEEARKLAEEKAKKAEEAAAKALELEAKVRAAEAEKEAIEKQVRLSSDPELTRFKFLFEAWQDATAAMFEQLSKLESDKQGKMKAAIKAVMEEQL